MKAKPAPQRFPHHPLSKLFPLMGADDKTDLREAIKRNGQRRKIILLEGQILDGRNREDVVLELGQTPEYRDYDFATDGPDPLQLVLDENLERRHLTPGQKAAAATDALAFFEESAKARSASNLKQNGGAATPAASEQKNPPPYIDEELHLEAGKVSGDVTGGGAGPHDFDEEAPAGEERSATGRSREKVAAQFQTSPASVARAQELKENDPEGFEQVKAGTTPLATATKKAKEKKKQQTAEKEKDDPEIHAWRVEHVPALTGAVDAEFAKAFAAATILKTKEEAEAFLALTDEEKKAVQHYIVTGWEVKKALKFHTRALDGKDTIESLILRAAASGVKTAVKFNVNGWDISVKIAKG